MSYVEKNLLPSEQITYRGHLHWVIYVKGLLELVLALVAAFGAFRVPQYQDVLLAGAALLAVIGLLTLLAGWIHVRSSEFAVTDKRVLIKVGFIRRHSLELMLNKVEGIGVDQGIMGRILGYGSISVSGTGGSKEAFRQIADPLEFRRQVQSRVSA